MMKVKWGPPSTFEGDENKFRERKNWLRGQKSDGQAGVHFSKKGMDEKNHTIPLVFPFFS
jgi:hypothetical protein